MAELFGRLPCDGAFATASRNALCHGLEDERNPRGTLDLAERHEAKRAEARLLKKLARCGLRWCLVGLDVATRKRNLALLLVLQDGQESTPSVRDDDASDLLHVLESR